MKNLIFSVLVLLLLSLGELGCGVTKPLVQPAGLKADSSKVNIAFQEKRDFSFNKGKVIISNKFAAARLNAITQQNDSTFNISITSENAPINPSPWYAFKVWSEEERNLYFNLNYPGTVHRYNPKVSQDGHSWKEINDVQLSDNKKVASFKLSAGSDTSLVAAQELLNTSDNDKWTDSLAKLPDVKRQIIGYSLLGKPVTALNIGKAGKKLVVVLSRQHPPEVTGYMAMQEFIRAIVAPSALANDFRSKFEVVLIPLLNPDGVDEGNWRHSAAGVDLNRDWDHFLQPETRSVQTYLLKRVKQQAKVYFGIDFHSTYEDVFYTNEDQPGHPTHLPGFTNKWLNSLKTAIPGLKLNVKPSPNGGNVSKSWMGRALGAEALTYEVGDDTSRPLLKLKGKAAAETMMQLLLAEKTD